MWCVLSIRIAVTEYLDPRHLAVFGASDSHARPISLSTGSLCRCCGYYLLHGELWLSPASGFPRDRSAFPACLIALACFKIFVMVRYFDGSCAGGGKFLARLPFQPALGQVIPAKRSCGALLTEFAVPTTDIDGTDFCWHLRPLQHAFDSGPLPLS